MAKEFNFDGIVGPTHNYAGLSYGNLASESHRQQIANPRAAALQGLAKMKANFDAGVGQAILPPLARPRLSLLRELGFSGDDSTIINAAWKIDPVLVAVCFSASNMWTANAATVSPSPDCSDGKLHLTPANLSTTMHRAIEHDSTVTNLRWIFSDPEKFEVHSALPSMNPLADEGAANHTRLCHQFGETGIEIFAYGRSALGQSQVQPSKYPARQTFEASQAIARNHRLKSANTFFVQQNPQAIDAGVFHNDVISVGNQNVFLVHELAFIDGEQFLETLQNRYRELTGDKLFVELISNSTMSLEDSVKSYLFNSQILSLENGSMCLVCPSECENIESAANAIDQILAGDSPISTVRFMDLKQSMNNGGGPACLRLRVVLNDDQLDAIHQGVIFSEELFEKLSSWVNRHYRESLALEDLRDPNLISEIHAAFRDLADVLDIPEAILLN